MASNKFRDKRKISVVLKGILRADKTDPFTGWVGIGELDGALRGIDVARLDDNGRQEHAAISGGFGQALATFRSENGTARRQVLLDLKRLTLINTIRIISQWLLVVIAAIVLFQGSYSFVISFWLVVALLIGRAVSISVLRKQAKAVALVNSTGMATLRSVVGDGPALTRRLGGTPTMLNARADDLYVSSLTPGELNVELARRQADVQQWAHKRAAHQAAMAENQARRSQSELDDPNALQ